MQIILETLQGLLVNGYYKSEFMVWTTLLSTMFRQKALLLSTCLLAFIASLTLALPPGAPWTNFASKPVYSRALGSPAGIDTISVPYMPKSSFMPKFVDPKAFISKKTDMLSNLFSGIGPVAYNVADTKPIIPYGASGPASDNVDSANALFNKRDMLQDGKEKIIDGSNMYKRGMFGPFAPKFGPMGSMGPISPKIGPFTPFSSETMPNFMDKASFSRRRSIEVPSSAENVNTISDSSSYPKVVEGISATKPATGVPKEYLPGMFGPFGPGESFAPSSFGPVMDPSAIISKKSEFLDTLFKNLATSTPASTTEISTPKSTVVPPGFWVSSSVIPGPTEYTQKVSDFLDKLFNSINVTSLANDDSDAKSDFLRSLKPDDSSSDKIARSLDDASSIAAAKDAIVDAILSELGNLKGDMIATLNDLIAYEKSATAAAAKAKKPFKPFSGAFPFAKPTIDPTLPFQQRMTALSQVFDMLTELQRNISVVTKNAIATNASTPDNPELSKVPLANGAVGASPINNTLLNAILKKISTVDSATPTSYSTSYSADPIKENSVMSRALSKGPTSFWVSYPESSAPAVKRQTDDDSLPYFGYENDNDRHDHSQYRRGVQMQMHQGYQSLPAGSVESVQAGGGSTPGHQGGGIKLLIQIPKLPNSQAPGFQRA
ncbi:PREDICTED: uncharacterized protein LOC108756616 [Trachymyrmex septentrionalis]|uniref:uncharacterized protein LOC108756616 n=1 Tax=Trachymyrmex septentrionalis TaxID=34720 RepID=UPI00084F2550|nr:PREDICTED: uncharacterized protein LOC108756616 [Trachymyrmex septentrionalis]